VAEATCQMHNGTSLRLTFAVIVIVTVGLNFLLNTS